MTDGVRRIGVLGGTFDPPHHGHLAVAVAAAHHLRLDRTMLVVANEPWQKVGERTITAASTRLEMVRAMLADVDDELGLMASDVEIEHGGASYTADTLATLHEGDPDAEHWLIVGADVAGSLDTWERPDEVKRLAGLAVFDRAGIEPPLGALRADAWRAERVPLTRLDVRSTDLRAMVGRGEPIEGLVSTGVIRVIEREGLYAEPR